MSKNRELVRASIIDGTTEQQPSQSPSPISTEHFVPITQQVIVLVMTLEGLEEVVQQRVVGFKKEKK